MNEEKDKVNKSPISLQDGETDACVNCKSGCCSGKTCGGDSRCHLQAHNWLEDIPGGFTDFDIVEVHFKNTRKGFYRNSTHLPLEVGDMVAVEAVPGHDIGRVAMTGKLVKLQMKRANLRPDAEILRVFRKAKAADLERYEKAKARETDTMIRSRQIAADLNLKMKIGDVEYQGDGNKAIFYYIADERVDFRQLIKVLADTFKIRVEMKQIGARQEAGRIGGIGPCGRPLCCASWMTSFVSVATSAARYQDISLNPQKLAGQCAKLKCCINFEIDDYMEASRSMPNRDVVLETKDGQYYHFKTDLFKREVTYSTDKQVPANLVTLSADRVFEVIQMNRNGEKPDKLEPENGHKPAEVKAFGDIIGQDNINRFDKKKKKNRGRGNKDRDKEKSNGGEQKSSDNRSRQGRGGNQQQGRGDKNESKQKDARADGATAKVREDNQLKDNQQREGQQREGQQRRNRDRRNRGDRNRHNRGGGQGQQANAEVPRNDGGNRRDSKSNNANNHADNNNQQRGE